MRSRAMSPLPLLLHRHQHHLFLLLLLCAGDFALSHAAPDGKASAYEVLKSYNFPIGLLPKGVLDYDLDPSTGEFSAYLNETCSFPLQGSSYHLKYQSTISGYISKNRLTDLSGVSVKVLFLWIDIVEVARYDDELDFSVGIASADFPIANFHVSPKCGCGLDCLTLPQPELDSRVNLRTSF